MVQQEEQISRKKRKALLARLKERIQPKMGLVLFSAVLSWVQFLMRLISFFLIARGFAAYLEGKELDLVGLLAMLLGLNAFGFGVALFAKKLQGLASQFARDSLKQSFFAALMAQDGQFESQKTAADVFTIASQGIDSLDTYYSYYMASALRTYFNCATVLALVFFIFPKGGLIFILALPLIPLSIIAMQKRSKKIMNRYWMSYMDVGNLFLDNLKGLNTLYSYQADDLYEKSFNQQAEDFRDATMELLSFQLQRGVLGRCRRLLHDRILGCHHAEVHELGAGIIQLQLRLIIRLLIVHRAFADFKGVTRPVEDHRRFGAAQAQVEGK